MIFLTYTPLIHSPNHLDTFLRLFHLIVPLKSPAYLCNLLIRVLPFTFKRVLDLPPESKDILSHLVDGLFTALIP